MLPQSHLDRPEDEIGRESLIPDATRAERTAVEATVGSQGANEAMPHDAEAQLFRMALGAASAVAWVWDVEQDVLAWLGDVKRLYGFEGSATSGPSDTFLKTVHPDDRAAVTRAVGASLTHGVDYEVEYRSMLGDGTIRWHRTKGTTVTDANGNVTRMLGVATDITERRDAEERLAHLALHDPLTGLANRVLLMDRLALALDRRARAAKQLAVLFVDLDGFKDVNDRHGHEAGDEILVTSAARLRSVLRPADTIARLGGDEFVVVAEVGSSGEGANLASRLVQVLSEPHQIDGHTVICTASVGLRVAGASSTPASLLRDADAAMYQAKGLGAGGGGWAAGETVRRQ